MLLIDWIECLLQLLCMGFCSIWAMRSALRCRESWFFQLIAGAFACYFLGTLFYTLHFWITGDWPKGISPSDLSFFGSYTFFFTADRGLIHTWNPSQRKALGAYRFKALLAPGIMVIAHIIIIWVSSGLLNNLLYTLTLSFLSYNAILLFMAERDPNGDSTFHNYHIAELLFITAEVLIFVVSANGWNTAYYVFTFLQYPTAIGMVAAARKAMET